MTIVGFHASHERIAPSELLRLVVHAERAGFRGAMSSDHFKPWGPEQGQAGFAWSWLGAAMAKTRLPFGVVTAPGYRYHPAVIAQAAATLAEMFPRRFWLALGSGQRLNEDVTGMAWPEKPERNARLRECAEIIRALLAGDTVTHRGRVVVVDAKLYTRPRDPPKLLAAAVTETSAELAGSWADGLLTVSAEPDQTRRVVDAFRRGGGEGKPLVMQVGLSWAPNEEQALAEAHSIWRYTVLGGEVNWELRSPEDFDLATRFVRPEDVRQSILVSSDLGRHAAWLAQYVELGFSELHLHQVGGDPWGFIDAFAADVLPRIQGLGTHEGSP